MSNFREGDKVRVVVHTPYAKRVLLHLNNRVGRIVFIDVPEEEPRYGVRFGDEEHTFWLDEKDLKKEGELMGFKVGDKVFYKTWVDDHIIRSGAGVVTYIDDTPINNYLVDIGMPEIGEEQEQWFSESDLELLDSVATGQLQLEELVEDKVNSPNHYNTGRYEVIDLIEKSLTPEEFRGYLKGNVIKYLMRYQFKNGVEDLSKATKYIEFLQRLFTGWDK